MPSIKSIANPELLVWARKSVGLTPDVAAKKIGVKEERLAQMESGEDPPTIAQLRKIGEVYKRPMAVFFLSAPPKDFDAIRDFRSLPGGPTLRQSYDLLVEIRRAHARREISIELAEDLGDELPPSPKGFSGSDTPQVFAQKIRDFLGVSLTDQYRWQTGSESRRGWQAAVEEQGILVFHAPRIELAEMRGFSISKWPLPVISVNAKDTETGRLFSILHELTHILLGDGGVCNDHGTNEHSAEVEVFCNAVAGQTLVPLDALEAEARKPATGQNWKDEELKRLASRFGVSREVITRRLLDSGKVTNSFYLKKRDQFSREALELVKMQKAKQGEFKIQQSIMICRDKGEPMVRLVLRALKNDFITTRDVSEFLGMKTRHIESLEKRVVV